MEKWRSFLRSNKGEPDPGILTKIVYGAIGLTVLFLLFSTVVLSHFNTTYNYTITGLSVATTQGLFLLVLVLALIGFAIGFLPRIGKR